MAKKRKQEPTHKQEESKNREGVEGQKEEKVVEAGASRDETDVQAISLWEELDDVTKDLMRKSAIRAVEMLNVLQTSQKFGSITPVDMLLLPFVLDIFTSPQWHGQSHVMTDRFLAEFDERLEVILTDETLDEWGGALIGEQTPQFISQLMAYLAAEMLIAGLELLKQQQPPKRYTKKGERP